MHVLGFQSNAMLWMYAERAGLEIEHRGIGRPLEWPNDVALRLILGQQLRKRSLGGAPARDARGWTFNVALADPVIAARRDGLDPRWLVVFDGTSECFETDDPLKESLGQMLDSGQVVTVLRLPPLLAAFEARSRYDDPE